MTDTKDFQAKVQRIGDLVAELETIQDREARAGAKALMQLVLDLHSAALERVLEIVAKDTSCGQRAIDELGDDALVSSLLVLYGLHPLDLESRVLRAIEKVGPRVSKGGGELELLGIENGVVRVQIAIPGHSCGSTAKTLKSMVEDAIFEAAPDLTELVVEGGDEKPGSTGFVPLGKLSGVPAAFPGAQR
jgi:Fe-S cluster biogenesis protein NfuA